ncbi:ferritin-like domain-containing protein [Nostoc sp. WHI]|uniref:ferritin-like domain-containing protein n=1 Tax=Nostoc sp. WHI TaxID=2650611 RepID=UPI0018C55ACA|nr:ferritin-like domain-containing protein [Nostoc sp. WHI]MBG1269316.1 ferritin-like domain-containing protein [Nostoc sp. WHI]
MLNTLSPVTEDLAGQSYAHPHYFQTQHRLRSLIDKYLAVEKLHDRLQDLPLQFANPQPRPWKPIDWQTINRNQIIGIDPEIFLSILIGAMDTEAPIRGYTQTSRQYLEKLHPQMAHFVGGTVAEDDNLLEIGLWEKEERQHTPALIKVYTQLTGEKITPNHRTVRAYLPTDDPYEDLYRQIGRTLIKTRSPNYQRNNLIRTLRRMMATLNWNAWSFTNKTTLLFTFTYTMHRLWTWNNTLPPKYLQNLFETSH